MLSALAPLLLAAGTGANLEVPLDAPFGFPLGEPLPLDAIAASVADRKRQPQLPENLATADPFETGTPPTPAAVSGWHYLEPLTLPETLDRGDSQLMGLLTEQRLPARLVLTVPERGCEGVYAWINDSLKRKYAVADGDAEVGARAPHLRAVRYRFEQRQIDVACGPDVRLQYTDEAALADWRREQQLLRAVREQEAQAAAAVAERIAEAEGRTFADAFTLGNASRLQGGLGVTFGQVFPAPQSFTADAPMPVALPDLPAPFAAGSFEIELGPDAVPIELKGTFPDPSGVHFTTISRALRAKYGAPIKDTARHLIFRVNGNFFVVRALPAVGKARITLMDGAARRAQRDRARAAEAARLAALEEQFKKETRGL